ncbi:MAG TPA: SRPBCC domain-containing protein, partial [Caulobacteraceae bacterium]|nr:SRPBCC domain-containing protein [Caulobacteraceae bacterium]
MTGPATETRSIVIERELPFPPDKVWRALTQPHLLGEWLMKNDFEPVAGRYFKMHAEWGTVDGRVLTIEPNKTLACTWEA